MSLFSFAHPPINLLSNFDGELQNFYRRVLLEEENLNRGKAKQQVEKKAKNEKVKKQVEKKAKKEKAKKQVEKKAKKGKAKKRASKTSSEKETDTLSKTSSEKETDTLSKTSNEKETDTLSKTSNEKETDTLSKTSSEKEADVMSKTDLELNSYVFRYGPCYTSAVANHFLSMVNSNPLIFRDALWKRCVKICCLGGGPASEVVAISKIFSSAQDWFWLSTKKPLHLQVTIVDNDRHWVKTVDSLRQVLQQTTCVFDASKMDISIRFLWADLTEPLNSDVESALKEADIVTMVKFISAVCPSAHYSGIAWLVQDIAANMKTDSVLFYLDTGINRQCNLLHTVLRNLNDIKCIYGPIQLEAFTLTLDSIYRCIKLFWKTFENICLTSCIINTCAWVKRGATGESEINAHPLQDLPFLSGKARREKFEELERQCQEKDLASQETLAAFHRKVRRVLRKKKKRIVKEETECFFLDYPPKVYYKDLFQTKSKNRRISLREEVKNSLV